MYRWIKNHRVGIKKIFCIDKRCESTLEVLKEE